MSRIRCLSLHQPWASLIAIGAKRIETRSWSTSYRGPIAIHAAKNKSSMRLALEPPFYTALHDGYGFSLHGPDLLPLGGIVAVADLVDCLSVNYRECLEGRYSHLNTPNERAFGDFGVDRFGWMLENVRRIDPMIPLVGRQGLWSIDASILGVEVAS